MSNSLTSIHNAGYLNAVKTIATMQYADLRSAMSSTLPIDDIEQQQQAPLSHEQLLTYALLDTVIEFRPEQYQG